METSEPFVVGVTATHRRPAELARLLALLGAPLRAMVVVDNASDPATRAVAEASPVPAVYLAMETNLGCGGGLREGEQVALARFPEMTHLWILDDDCVVLPETLPLLLEAMARAGGDVAHPLTEGPEGRLGWFPGLLDRAKFAVARREPPPEEYLALCGDEPVPFSWSQGVALLATRRVLDELGLHRADYLVRGEDLEFSLRITHRHLGIYVPKARVRHLPPSGSAPRESEYAKHRAMLQNIAYTACRLPHGRRILRTLPGNWWRFLRTWGASPRVLGEAAGALWLGAICGWPAGRVAGASPRRGQRN
jgi:GT2 family glycosyltransferase